MSARRAVFLDRDGTIIEDTAYLARPAAVRLLPGAAGAIARLNRAGMAAIVVTNQSGIARGLLDESAYADVARRVEALLDIRARAGVPVELVTRAHLPLLETDAQLELMRELAEGVAPHV